MKKKVCMVVPSFSAKGGIATVVSGYRGSELEKQYNVKYIESYCDGNKVQKIFKAIGAYFSFLKEMVINKPDLVHIHSSFGGSFYRKLPFVCMASIFNIPIINHIHGSEIANLYINASEKKKKIVENCFNKCRYLVVLSEEWKKKLEVVKTKTPKIVIENYSTIHKECLKRKNHQDKTILFLGFITELKGCFDIPDIAKKVIEQNANVKFILAGSGEIEKLQAIIEEKGISQYFSFPGWVRKEEKENLLKNADIFLLPSYTEAMPMSILEAMGYGLPIVTTNVGGIPQLVEDGKNGYMTDPGNIDSFVKAILKLISNNELIYDMGKKGIEKAYEKYSLEKHLEKVCKLYENVLGE